MPRELEDFLGETDRVGGPNCLVGREGSLFRRKGEAAKGGSFWDPQTWEFATPQASIKA